MNFGWSEKDPGDTDDFEVDWATDLAGETISSVTWTLPAALTLVSQTNTTTVARVRISGGASMTHYPVECRIVTSSGRSLGQTWNLTVVDR